MTVIDFATKVIPQDQKVWLIHPGRYRKFYQTFKTDEIVFLSMPGLNLSAKTCADVAAVRQHVRMAKALRKYHQDDIDGKAPAIPSKNPKTYSDNPGSNVNSDVGNVVGLYHTAAPGDLVVVTGRGYYESVLIGEIKTPFDPNDLTTAKGLEYAKVPYRRVKWITKEYAKKDFSRPLAESLVNRKAIIQLPKDNITEQLYQFAYSSYVIGDRSKIDLYGPKYKGNKLTGTNSSTTLVAYLAAAYGAIEKNEIKKFEKLAVEEAIETYLNPQLIQHFYQEFHSPGKFVLYTSSAVLASFITLGVTIATSDLAGNHFVSNIKVENSVEKEVHPQLQDACDQYNYLLNSLSHDGKCKIQELGADAHKRIGLKTNAKIK